MTVPENLKDAIEQANKEIALIEANVIELKARIKVLKRARKQLEKSLAAWGE